MKPISNLRAALIVFTLALTTFWVADIASPPPASAGHPPLTIDAYIALGACESNNTPDIATGNGFYGEVQWLPATWRAAAAAAGYTAEASVRPDRVPRTIQIVVTQSHWSMSDPSTQWPNCYDDALRAMGVDAPCKGRNVVACDLAGRIVPGSAPLVEDAVEVDMWDVVVPVFTG